MIEEWRPCARGYYEASSLGRIRRAAPTVRRKRNHNGVIITPPNPEPLRPQLRKRDGRYHVSVWVDGRRLLRGVHQLVAEAFLGQCPPGLEVNHINGEKTDNRAVNLEYLTHAENCAHAGRTGLIPTPLVAGERNPNAKLSAEQVAEMRRRREEGEGVTALARAFGVCTSSVDYITRRVSWRHVA